MYLERATTALRGNGRALLDDTLLQYLSPLGWEHINLTGDYLWRSSAKLGAGKFRPLRPLPPANVLYFPFLRRPLYRARQLEERHGVLHRITYAPSEARLQLRAPC